MDEKEFKKHIKKDKYQVFLFTSSCPFPINFATHSWFVTNKKGKINRLEVLEFEGKTKAEYEGMKISLRRSKLKIKNHLYKNLFPPTRGINKYFWDKNRFYKGRLKKHIEGGKRSIAYKMVNFIEKNAFKYKYKKEYYIFGPNSNTFIQWIINKFPESGFRLSWRAIGKNYKVEG